ncbi:maleylpyruvate isomerase family mycothiol-dependent enzyme [Saccharomonospora saliphila]|uniref:maleylpyruvate isomerase family mycothiol-dependent enzyme n=1 Tax=Saccharomonospora saliphila TaxID=369829 RepID=UPI000374E22A|nr:maleylpyruvate isomerase family mycothiol-dependent enzyme [Saccharomonospora saliphila]
MAFARTRRFAHDERREFAHYLATLEPEQWDAATLCEDWRVREVVAHVVSYDELGLRGLARRFRTARATGTERNAVGVAEYVGRTPDELTSLLERYAVPRGLPAFAGGMVALVDGLIHHQDIRRALGTPRHIPADRLRHTLRLALLAPPIGAYRRARGLRLVATDLGWSAGRGRVVEGPGEALLMALAGRRGVVTELSGPGRSLLASRIG